MKTLKQLREERAALIKQQKSLFDTAKAEKRNINSDENLQFERMEGDLKEIRAQIVTAEAMERNLAELSENELAANRTEGDTKETPTYGEAFWRMMQFRAESLTAEQRSLMAQNRTQLAGTDSAGGYTVPEGFSNELFQEMLAWGGMLQVGRMYNTATGNPIKWPTNDDTGQKGAILGEAATAPDQDTTFGAKNLTAYTYTSKMIKVSMELMQDSAFDLPSFIREVAATRLGRITNEHLTTGTGTGQPEGVITAAGAGLTSAAATAVTRPEIVKLIHSVDPAYRRQGVARLMFNDNTLADIKQLSFSASDDRPLWQASIREGEPDRIEGFAYTINQDMADIATGAKAIAFGDFSKYIIRRVGNPVMLRLNERFAESLQTAFLMYQRMDGKLLSSNAVKVITQA